MMRVIKLPDFEGRSVSTPRLLTLQPRGLESGPIEAMSSYICRLAKLHGAQPHSFATNVRRLFTDYVNKGPGGGGGGGLMGCNSIGVLAQQTAHSLENGGALDNAIALTLVPWKPLLEKAANGLLSGHVRYCQDCLIDDLSAYGEPYQRLIWQLQPVTACHVHKCRLTISCPKCQNPLPVTPWLPEPFFCLECKQQTYDMPHNRQDSTLADTWLAHELSEMMSRTHREGAVISPKAINNALHYLLECYCDGSRAEFERRVGIRMETTYKWFKGRAQPKFPSLIHILRVLKVSPSDLFLTNNQELDWEAQSGGYKKPVTIQSREVLSVHELSAISKELEEQLRSEDPLAGMAKTAAKLGVSYTVIRYHLPNKYAEYRKRWCQEEAERIESRKRNRIRKVCEQAKAFLLEDVYPSQKMLRRTGMVSATDLARQDVREALERLFFEYGWRPGGARI